MSYPGIIALMVCSLCIVASAFALQFINSALSEKDRCGVPAWIMAAALLLLCVAVFSLRRMPDPQQGNTFNSIALTAVMLGGICFKWLSETVAQKRLILHESVLTKAMLVAPLVVLLLGSRIFPARLVPGAFILWFLNGYFWHAVFSDIERISGTEKIVIRRREPPTLPHDFKRPDIC